MVADPADSDPQHFMLQISNVCKHLWLGIRKYFLRILIRDGSVYAKLRIRIREANNINYGSIRIRSNKTCCTFF